LSRLDRAARIFLPAIFAMAASLTLHAEPTTFASGGKRSLVHYFDSTVPTLAENTPPTRNGSASLRIGTKYASDADIRRNFATWLQTLDDATAHVSDRPGVDSRRIGFFGYSLGGYLAVARAADDPRIGAVVELAGGIDPGYASKVRRLPPLLILHGTRDQRVAPTEAEALEQLARRIGATSEKKLFDGEGHILSGGAFVDVFARGTAFFRKHLAR